MARAGRQPTRGGSAGAAAWVWGGSAEDIGGDLRGELGGVGAGIEDFDGFEVVDVGDDFAGQRGANGVVAVGVLIGVLALVAPRSQRLAQRLRYLAPWLIALGLALTLWELL